MSIFKAETSLGRMVGYEEFSVHFFFQSVKRQVQREGKKIVGWPIWDQKVNLWKLIGLIIMTAPIDNPLSICL